jgi:hypothetical protein
MPSVLKIPRGQPRAVSIPAFCTNKDIGIGYGIWYSMMHMLRNILLKYALILFFSSILMIPAHAADNDRCRESGIIVKNFTLVDRWYKRNNGECTIWNHHKVFIINQGETIEIFSDMTCRTFYCSENPLYKDYLSADENANCAVKILPYCSLTDM